MDVVDDLRVPHVLNLADGELGLGLTEDVPVAIVVVAYILVIELGRIGAFKRSAEGFPVPVGDDVDTVGILRRNQDEDRILEDCFELRAVFGDQLIRKLDCGRSGRNFGGVNRAGDHHHRFAFGDQFLRFGIGGLARVRELRLDLAVAVQVTQRVRIGNVGGDVGPALRGFAEFGYANLVAGFGESLEVAHHLVPIEQFPVGPHLMAEVALRSRDLGSLHNCCGEE